MDLRTNKHLFLCTALTDWFGAIHSIVLNNAWNNTPYSIWRYIYLLLPFKQHTFQSNRSTRGWVFKFLYLKETPDYDQLDRNILCLNRDNR